MSDKGNNSTDSDVKDSAIFDDLYNESTKDVLEGISESLVDIDNTIEGSSESITEHLRSISYRSSDIRDKLDSLISINENSYFQLSNLNKSAGNGLWFKIIVVILLLYIAATN